MLIWKKLFRIVVFDFKYMNNEFGMFLKYICGYNNIVKCLKGCVLNLRLLISISSNYMISNTSRFMIFRPCNNLVIHLRDTTVKVSNRIKTHELKP